MMLALYIFLGIAVVAALALHLQYGRKIRLLADLMKMDVEDLDRIVAYGLPGGIHEADPSADMRVVIEILDPLAVARKESLLGRAFTGVVPNYIRREVYRRVRNEVAQVMKSRGIDARVTVSRGFSIDG